MSLEPIDAPPSGVGSESGQFGRLLRTTLSVIRRPAGADRATALNCWTMVVTRPNSKLVFWVTPRRIVLRSLEARQVGRLA
jgi:hypothetical protein